ncbi:DNA polymerase delta subunit 4 [Sesamum indicum]|uniref:DNA polymerase delta subunit 4 n=1 Tax=Sesamum indicum TaxID=4182 RepID=A0A6I9T5T2_SESIN|nr:DNA polymerase delta subunit 4 [Sesamum indicum]
MASSDMKGFFRQKKKLGISKPKSSKRSPKPKHSASCGSHLVQPPALVSHGFFDLQDEYDDKEEVLRQFDMNMAYGPCLGMSRLDRWERANALGLHPPKEVENLLRAGKVNSECLWDGRV